MTGQRWEPTVSPEVTAHVLAYQLDAEIAARFDAKIDYGFAPSDCWIWTAGLSSEGYGVFALPPRPGVDELRRIVRAHRVSWLWRFGPTPEDRPILDHPASCVGRFCINPHHLEPVDDAENKRRRLGVGRAAQRARRYAELERRAARRAAGDGGVF